MPGRAASASNNQRNKNAGTGLSYRFYLLFWVLSWLVIYLSFLTILDPLKAVRNTSGFLLPLILPVQTLDLIFEHLFLRKKIIKSILLSTLVISGFAFFNYYLFKYIINDPEAQTNTVLSIIVFFLIFRGIRFFYTGVKQQFKLNEALAAEMKTLTRLREIEAEKLRVELDALKAQINPHFLFNNLNNIYSLAETNHPGASKAILMLSDMMRYMLESGKKETIALKEEIRFINDYISLEKIRLEDSCEVKFTQNTTDINTGIPPLLFLPLLENCFKHGVSANKNNNLIIIELLQNSNEIVFQTYNNIAPRPIKSSRETTKAGLSNLNRRLSLLPEGSYSYDHENSGSVYTSKLTIKTTLL